MFFNDQFGIPQRMLTSFVLIGILNITIVLAVFETGDIGLGCPSSSYRHGDYCYSLSTDLRTNFHDALAACRTAGGTLALVRDEDTMQFLRRLSVRKFMMDYWIGLTDKHREGQWFFSDGTRLRSNFDQWFPGEPSNHHETEHCACLWMMRGLKWNDDSCEKQHFYVCQFNESHCPETGNVFRLESLCFLLSSGRANFKDASDTCRAMGGHLAVDKDVATHTALTAAIYQDRSWLHLDQEMLSELLQFSDKYTWVRNWMGVFRNSSGTLQYLDGTPVTTNSSFWNVSEVNGLSCGSIARHWYTDSCQSERGFICQYTAVQSFVNVSSSERCSSPQSSVNVSSSERNSSQAKCSLSFGQAAFVIILLCCFLLGVACATVLLKFRVFKSQIQTLRKRKINTAESSITFASLETNDPA